MNNIDSYSIKEDYKHLLAETVQYGLEITFSYTSLFLKEKCAHVFRVNFRKLKFVK